MKKLKFLVDVPDKYTNEKYTKGQIKEFEDERAKEILATRRSNGETYAEEVIETVKQETTVKKTTRRTTNKSTKKEK